MDMAGPFPIGSTWGLRTSAPFFRYGAPSNDWKVNGIFHDGIFHRYAARVQAIWDCRAIGGAVLGLIGGNSAATA
jgi:hypothetical protein